jgi:biotin carboxyl carrier protein
MPGTVLSVKVTAGQQVRAGDVLAVLEAMKMELTLDAPLAGTLTTVDAAAGRQVARGQLLFEVTPAAAEPAAAEPAAGPPAGSGAEGR